MAATPSERTANGNVKKQEKLLDTWDPRNAKDVHNLKPHPVTGRLIDSHPGIRTRPMRVLCLGMPRTGTMSLFAALKILGYKPYHMAEALGSGPRTNMTLWIEALNAKYYGKGKLWGREEFDKIFGDYDAVLDVPSICFVEELVAAYPDAKVILTLRDIETWLRSMDATAGRILRWNWPLVAPWDPSVAGPFWKHAQIITPAYFGTLNNFHSKDTPARAAFTRHYELVRRVVPKDRLIEFQSSQGWKPICQFLDIAVPDQDYPRINDANEFIFVNRLLWWIAFGKMVTKVSLMIAVPAGGVAAAIWWRSRR